MESTTVSYPAQLTVDYPPKLNRVSSFFRLIFAIPIVIVLAVLAGGSYSDMSGTGKEASTYMGGIEAGLAIATALLIIVRQRYPKWWFDFALELNRFSTRVGAYILLLTDQYPSTVEHQSVQLNLEYPDVKQDLNRWLPIVKWLLAIPHYIVLVFLLIAAFGATVIAWFAILFTGKYPRSLFDFVVGVIRWSVRVNAYAALLITDKYPPFSLK